MKKMHMRPHTVIFEIEDGHITVGAYWRIRNETYSHTPIPRTELAPGGSPPDFVSHETEVMRAVKDWCNR